MQYWRCEDLEVFARALHVARWQVLRACVLGRGGLKTPPWELLVGSPDSATGCNQVATARDVPAGADAAYICVQSLVASNGTTPRIYFQKVMKRGATSTTPASDLERARPVPFPTLCLCIAQEAAGVAWCVARQPAARGLAGGHFGSSASGMTASAPARCTR